MKNVSVTHESLAPRPPLSGMASRCKFCQLSAPSGAWMGNAGRAHCGLGGKLSARSLSLHFWDIAFPVFPEMPYKSKGWHQESHKIPNKKSPQEVSLQLTQDCSTIKYSSKSISINHLQDRCHPPIKLSAIAVKYETQKFLTPPFCNIYLPLSIINRQDIDLLPSKSFSNVISPIPFLIPSVYLFTHLISSNADSQYSLFTISVRELDIVWDKKKSKNFVKINFRLLGFWVKMK